MDIGKNILSKLREAGPTRIDYMKATDDELVELVQKNKDRKAEEVLIKRYEKLIVSSTRGLFIKGGDESDVKQEGLIGFVDAIKSYVPGKNKNFKNFAMLAAKRQVMDAARAASAKKHSFVSDAEDYDSIERASSKGDPLDKVIDKDSQKRINDYMKKNLTDVEKSVLALYLKNLTYPEIAAKLGVTRKSVDNAMQRIRSKMNVYRSSIKDSKLLKIVECIINDTLGANKLLKEAQSIFNPIFRSIKESIK